MPSEQFKLGGLKGYMPPPTINALNDKQFAQTREILRQSWNNTNAKLVSQRKNMCTPFRAINNSADIYNRSVYDCANGVGVNCPTTKIANCNPKYTYDGSDYTAFLRQKVTGKKYNSSR